MLRGVYGPETTKGSPPLTTLTELAESMQDLLTTTADELARRTGFIKRQRKLTGSHFAQTIVFATMGHRQPTQSQRLKHAANVGLNLSRQGLEKRLDDSAAEFLRELLRVAVTQAVAVPVAVPVLARFTALNILDSSTVALPDELADRFRGGRSGTTKGPKAALKLTVGLDLKTGTLCGPELADGRAADLRAELAQASPPPGGLAIADLNYFDTAKFARWSEAGAFFLSRLKVRTAVYDPKGPRLNVLEMLQETGQNDLDREVHLGSKERVPCRLIARRVPAEVAAVRRQRLLDKSKRRGDRASALALALCDWTILLTNVPRERLSVEEAVVLARMRWQIELIFKLWKSGGGIAEWRTDKPRVALCEVYGKLLTQVVRHWMIVVGAWTHCDRSLTKAAEIIQSMAMSLGAAMRSRETLSGLLHHMGQIMAITARMDKRKKSPNAYDLMLSLEPEP
jgi:hypothetical protein